MTINAILKRIFPILLAGLVFTACSDNDNPVGHEDHDHDHAEAVGLVLSSSGQELVRYEEGEVSGQITVSAGEETPLLSLQFIAQDGDLFTPEEDHYSLDTEIADTNVAEFEQHDEDGKWKFHIHGESAGTTTIIIKILHGDHADFVSPEINIVVSE